MLTACLANLLVLTSAYSNKAEQVYVNACTVQYLEPRELGCSVRFGGNAQIAAKESCSVIAEKIKAVTR